MSLWNIWKRETLIIPMAKMTGYFEHGDFDIHSWKIFRWNVDEHEYLEIYLIFFLSFFYDGQINKPLPRYTKTEADYMYFENISVKIWKIACFARCFLKSSTADLICSMWERVKLQSPNNKNHVQHLKSRESVTKNTL